MLTHSAKKRLDTRISHSTILDNHSKTRGWAISLCLIPTILLTAHEKSANTLSKTNGAVAAPTSRQKSAKLKFTDDEIRKIITQGCESVIQAEATITEYDTIVGDGDCGYTLRDGAKQVMSFIKDTDLSQLPSTLGDLVDNLEVNMGGALYCIFLSSLAHRNCGPQQLLPTH
jgi:hypothetical protein